MAGKVSEHMYTMSAITADRLPRGPLAGPALASSRFVDLLVGPHGIDRYLELLRPTLTVRDARAEVLAVRRQTPRSVTLTVAAERGLAADSAPASSSAWGSRSTACAARGRTRRRRPSTRAMLELTVTVHPEGLVSRHLTRRSAPGTILHLGDAARRVRAAAAGAGAARADQRRQRHHARDVDAPHAARRGPRRRDRPSSTSRAPPPTGCTGPRSRRCRTCDAQLHRHPREAAATSTPQSLGDLDGAYAAVCGPPALLDAARELFAARPPLTETFTPPSLSVSGGAAARDAALPAQRTRGADRRRDAARAGRGRRPDARVRLPDGHLPHLHLPQDRPAPCATCAPARSPTRKTRTSSSACRSPPGTSRSRSKEETDDA